MKYLVWFPIYFYKKIP